MSKYYYHKQKCSDKFGVSLVRFGFKFKAARERYNFKFRYIFTNTLSDNYKYSKDIDFQTISVGDASVETINYKNQEIKYALIHLHGGAYVSGYNDTYRKVAKKYLGSNHNLKVYSLDYSLAPIHPFPKALNETIDLYRYLLEIGFSSQNVIIAGDSAGGGLSLALGLALKDQKIDLPKAMVVMSPWTDLAETGRSYRENKDKDPFFGKGTLPLDKVAYAGDNSLKHPYISPKYGNFTNFSNLLMIVGSDELILSDTLDIGLELPNAIIHSFEGMFHVFPLGFNKMASSRTAWKIIYKYINQQLGVIYE